MVGAEGLPGERKGTGHEGAIQAPTPPPPGQGWWQQSGEVSGGAPQTLGQKAQDVRPGSRCVPGRSGTRHTVRAQ